MEKGCSNIFYIKKYNYVNKTDFILDNISPLLKRKLSLTDKVGFYTMDKTFDKDVEELIFASRYGELERLFKIIEQYKNDNEVSPNTFSSSVHNFTIGAFSKFKGVTVPYTSISSGNRTLSNGLLNSILSDKKNVIFCFCDTYQNDIQCLSLNISKDEGLIKCKYEKNDADKEDNFDNFIEFLDGSINKIQLSFYKIERCE